MPHPLEHVLKDVLDAVKYNAWITAQNYKWQQEKESEKTPGSWRGYNVAVNVNGTQSVLIVGGNLRRSSLSIYNKGPGSIMLSSNDFDGTTLTARLASANPNEVVQILVLDSGESSTIDTSAPVFAYNTNGSATLKVVETSFVMPSKLTPQADPAPRQAIGELL